MSEPDTSLIGMFVVSCRGAEPLRLTGSASVLRRDVAPSSGILAKMQEHEVVRLITTCIQV